MEHPHEPASIPLDRVRRNEKEAAAPAATQPDTRGKGCEGLRCNTYWRGKGRRKKWEEERKSERETRCTEKRPKVALTLTGPLSGELGAVRQYL